VLADVADLDRFVHRLLSKGPGTTLLTVRDKVFEVWHAPLRDPGGDAAGVAGMAIDVTGRHRAEEQRRAEQAVTKRMLHMQERDRQLTAYEIHDGLVQDITAAQMRLAGLLSGDQSLAKPLADQIAAAEELVSRAVREARRLISGLRPPALDEQGIVAAIERLVADQPPGGPKVRFAARLEPGRLDRLLEVSVYRIVQEAVNNARRHSGSDRIEIRLEQADERILIHVEDWGAGFDPARVAENRFGLQGIRQRARLLGGRADIDSGPGRGTRIDVELPVTHALDYVVNRDS
jgi:signal transduction histidine kinase